MAAVNILQGLDVFISVPTGYGKSAIFQVLPGCGQILVGGFILSLSSFLILFRLIQARSIRNTSSLQR